MGYDLRDYQVEASDNAEASLKSGKVNQFIYMSCGSGKSLVTAETAHRLNDYTLVLQPSVEILKQNYEKMMSYDVKDVALYSAAAKRKEHGLITFATIQSIYRNPEDFKRYKYVINDECHRISPSTMNTMYGKFFKAIGEPARLGLTGSPYRTTMRYLVENHMNRGFMEKDKYRVTVLTPLNRIINKNHAKEGANRFLYGNMIYKLEMQELIDMGYLCKPEYIMDYCGTYDYTNLKMNTTGADFDSAQLEAFVTDSNRVKQVVQACKDYDTIVNRNLIFCSSALQAEKCVYYAQNLGLKADVVTYKDSVKKRDSLLTAFRLGEIRHLFNVNILNTGYDFPALDCVTFARPTVSTDIWVQSCARVIRMDPDNPDKKAYIIDVAGVSKRLGRIETIRMGKEQGYKDCIVSEMGTISGVPLSKFRIKK